MFTNNHNRQKWDPSYLGMVVGDKLAGLSFSEIADQNKTTSEWQLRRQQCVVDWGKSLYNHNKQKKHISDCIYWKLVTIAKKQKNLLSQNENLDTKTG